MAQKELENDLKHYFKEIKSLFPVYGKKEKEFLTDFMSEVDEYTASNPTSYYMQLISSFGEPKIVVAQYITDSDSTYLLKQIRSSTLIKRCVLIIILLALISAVIFGAINYRLYVEAREQYIDREVTEIIGEK
jgi:hypothetical protein